MLSDLLTYGVSLMKHPLGFYILMVTISILQVWRDTGDQGPGSDHRTALPKVGHRSRCDLAERGLSLVEHGRTTRSGLRIVLPPGRILGRSPSGVGTRGGQMPGGGGSTRKVRTSLWPGFGKGRLHRLVGRRGRP